MSKQRVQLKEKELSIEDLKSDDYVGFIRLGDIRKWHVIYAMGRLLAISMDKTNYYAGFHTPNDIQTDKQCTTMQDCLLAQGEIKELYRFDNSKELYQWLAEG